MDDHNHSKDTEKSSDQPPTGDNHHDHIPEGDASFDEEVSRTEQSLLEEEAEDADEAE